MDDKLYKKTSDIATMLGISQTQVRDWTNDFSTFIKVKTTGNGTKLYDDKAIENILIFKDLIVNKGLTKSRAREEYLKNRSKIDRHLRIRKSLEHIKSILEDVRKSIK